MFFSNSLCDCLARVKDSHGTLSVYRISYRHYLPDPPRFVVISEDEYGLMVYVYCGDVSLEAACDDQAH